MEDSTPSESTEQPKKPTKTGLKRHVSRRNALIAGGLILLLVIAGLLLWRSRRMGFTKQFTTEGWHEIAVQSDEISGLTKGEPSLDKTNSLSASLRKFDGAIKDQKLNLAFIPLILNDDRVIKIYTVFITDMSAYSSRLAGMGDDITAITDEDISAVDSLATAAEQQTTKTKEQLKYLTETVNPELFDVGEYLESLKKLSDETKAKVAAEVKNKKQQAEQDVLDKQLVELSITGFMDGYISGDATKMKRYMTPAFSAEYNFSYLSAENRKYTYPSSYRIVGNTKQADGSYSVQVNVTNKYRDTETTGNDQYTTSMSYTVVYVSSSARWLVNTEKSI